MFETSDPEVVAQLKAGYRPQIVQSKRAKGINGQIVVRIDDPKRRRPGVAAAVAARREELTAQHEAADAWFEKQQGEAQESLAAR